MATANGTNGVTNRTNSTQALDFNTFKNVINGKLVDTHSHRQGIVPASPEPYVDMPVATEADLDDAVNAGREAFESWSQMPFEEEGKGPSICRRAGGRKGEFCEASDDGAEEAGIHPTAQVKVGRNSY